MLDLYQSQVRTDSKIPNFGEAIFEGAILDMEGERGRRVSSGSREGPEARTDSPLVKLR